MESGSASVGSALKFYAKPRPHCVHISDGDPIHATNVHLYVLYVDSHIGSIGSMYLHVGSMDLHIRSMDLHVGSMDLHVRPMHLHAGSMDLHGWVFALTIGCLLLQSDACSYSRMLSLKDECKV